MMRLAQSGGDYDFVQGETDMLHFVINQYWGGTKMAVYDKEQGFQSILSAALGGYQSKGFRLVELDDHCLSLYYQDEWIGVLSQGGATIPIIHEACQEYLESLSAS